MNIKIKGNKPLLASVIAIAFALFMSYLVFGLILPIESDTLQLVFFALMYMAVKVNVLKMLGYDTSERDRNYAEMDARLKIKKDKHKDEE